VRSAREEITSISDELDVGRSQREAKVVTTVTYRGEIEGEDVSGTETYEMLIGMERNGFTVEGNHSWKEATRMTEERTVDDPPTTREKAVPSSTLALSLLLLVGLALVRFRHEPASDQELREMRTASERENNAEWISEGSLPDVDATRVRMESLQDLVDAAIDQNMRVLHDPDENVYFFLDDGVLYEYEWGRSRGLRPLSPRRGGVSL